MGRSLAALAVAVLVSCGGEPVPPVGDEGPRKILAMAPSAAEIAHVLELDDRVVGVGDYVEWPLEWSSKPRLGGLFNPQLERIASLRPDLAILLESEEALAEQLEALGVDVLIIPSDTIGDLERAFQLVGERTGREAHGQRAILELRKGLRPDPLAETLDVVIVVGREPARLGEIVVAGKETFFNQLLSRLGASNAFGDAVVAYPQVSAEEIALRRPDAIVELQPLEVPMTRVEALRADWAPLATVPAVANGCLTVIAGTHVLIPGPRLSVLYRQLRTALDACLEMRGSSP